MPYITSASSSPPSTATPLRRASSTRILSSLSPARTSSPRAPAEPYPARGPVPAASPTHRLYDRDESGGRAARRHAHPRHEARAAAVDFIRCVGEQGASAGGQRAARRPAAAGHPHPPLARARVRRARARVRPGRWGARPCRRGRAPHMSAHERPLPRLATPHAHRRRPRPPAPPVTLSDAYHSLSHAAAAPSPPPEGVYLYGEVRCGKSSPMDMVFTCADAHIATAEHVQYHSFMISVYQMMHEYDLMSPAGRAAAGVFHPLDAVIALWLGRRNAADTGGGLLCFDEFQIADVTDARVMPRRAPSLRQRLRRRASAGEWGPWIHHVVHGRGRGFFLRPRRFAAQGVSNAQLLLTHCRVLLDALRRAIS